MTEPATQHPMRAAIRDRRAIEFGCYTIALFILPTLGLHGSDSLALAVAGLFLATINPWRHQ